MNKLLQINNINDISIFLGPKTKIEHIHQLKKYIRNPITFYAAYIDNRLGIDVATGSIAYDTVNKKLYGKDDDGFIEYKKECINLQNPNELVKTI